MTCQSGEPFFDSVDRLSVVIMFSVPAVKGIEFGTDSRQTGCAAVNIMRQIFDLAANEANNAGGVNGGITNGNDVLFRVAINQSQALESLSLP